MSASARIRRNPGVRIAVLAGGGLALLILLQSAASAVLRTVPGPALAATQLAAELLVCLLMILAYRAAVRALERRAAAEIALGGSLRLLIPGALLGGALFTSVYAILWAAGIARVEGSGALGGAIGALGAACAAAVAEEIIFRGALYRIVAERLGTTAALVFSAALFGLLHAANHGATVTSSVAIALEAGVLLAAAYAATRTLWLPIGIHFGWNFTEGGIFGAVVSGGHSRGLLKIALAGPDLWTGGAFGPEASLVAVLVCLVAAALLIRRAVRRGLWRGLRQQLELNERRI